MWLQTHGWWLLWLACGGLFAAAWPIMRAFRHGAFVHHVGPGVHCRNCDYELTGIDSDRCPECGNDLTRPKASGPGKRHRLWLPAGVSAIGLALLLAGAIGSGTAAAWRTPWFRIAPLSLVQWIAPEGHESAAGELVRRLDAGSLEDDDIVKTVDRLLIVQGDANADWTPDLGLFVEHARAMQPNPLSSEQWETYLEQTDTIKFLHRDRMPPGFDMDVGLTGQAGRRSEHTRPQSQSSLLIDATFVRWRIGDGPWHRERDPSSLFTHEQGNLVPGAINHRHLAIGQETADLPVGPASLEMVAAFRGQIPSVPGSVHTWQRTIVMPLEITEIESLRPMTISGPSDTQAMLDAMSGEPFDLLLLRPDLMFQAASPGRLRWELRFSVKPRSAALAGKLECRADRPDGLLLGTTTIASTSTVQLSSNLNINREAATNVDLLKTDVVWLIYRPSPDVLLSDSLKDDIVWDTPLAWPVLVEHPVPGEDGTLEREAMESFEARWAELKLKAFQPSPQDLPPIGGNATAKPGEE